MPALEERGSLVSTHYVETPPSSNSMLSWLSTTITSSRQPSSSTTNVNCDLDEDHPSCKDRQQENPFPKNHIPLRTKTRRFPTDNAIFVFISDIGAPAMIRSLVSSGDRSVIPRTHIRSIVKSALDEQWERLKFGKIIDGVVPFLPMESTQLQQVMKLKLRQMSKEFEGVRWLKLVVDDDVFDYLTSPQFVDYETHKIVLRPKQSNASVDNEDVVRSKQFVKYGGRALENGPLQSLQAQIHRYSKPFQPGKCDILLVYTINLML